MLERGAVEGELFHRGTVQALAPEETEVTPRLARSSGATSSVPTGPVLPREDAYRFRHLLIRDAAYDALPKARRAELHRRFAAWLGEHGESLVELDESLGYHLEQAAVYLADLGMPDSALAEEASRRLAAAGKRMYWRGDERASHSLLRRAVELVEQPDVHLQIAFAMSHLAARDAEPLLEEAARRAEARTDAAGAALARGLAAQMRLWSGEATTEEAEQLLRAALPLLEQTGDYAALAQTWFSLANGSYSHGGRFEQILHAVDMARSYEVLAGLPHQSSIRLYAMGLVNGPCPVAEALQRLDAFDSSIGVGLYRAVLLAMSDRIDEARELARAIDEHARQLGQPEAQGIAEVESMAGDHVAAAERLGRTYEWVHRTWPRRLRFLLGVAGPRARAGGPLRGGRSVRGAACRPSRRHSRPGALAEGRGASRVSPGRAR